jgi:uncharacterized repeat protein (TIGR01451 family)
MNADAGGGLSAHRLRTAVLAAIAAIAAWAVLATPAHALVVSPVCKNVPTVVPGSTFQSADGDQCDTAPIGITDWQHVNFGVGGQGIAIPDQPVDSSFSEFSSPGGSASKELNPDGWSFSTGSPNGKSDVKNAWVYPEIGAGGALFLNFAFEAADKQGSVSYNIELNAKQETFRNSRGYDVPKRANGDVLITFDSNGNGGADITLCRWLGDDPAQPWLSGIWDNCALLDASQAQGSTNDGFQIQNSLPGGDLNSDGTAGDGIFQSQQFAEGTVNLTDILQIGGPGQPPCVDFGAFWVRTRTSPTVTANPEDLIFPVPVSVSNCGKVIIKKQTAAPDAATKFNFTGSGFGSEVVGAPTATPTTFELGDGETETLNPVKPGSYTVSEPATASGYHLTDLSCAETGGTNTNPTTVDPPLDGVAHINVDPSETVTCTYTNTRDTGTITVVKRLVPSTDDGRFDLLVDGNVKANDVGNNGTTDQVVVPTGTYPVTEAGGNQGVGGSGPLTDLSHYVKSTHCEAPGQDPIDNADGPTVSVPVGAGQNWTCTITNTRKTGTVQLLKDIVPVTGYSPDPGRFDLTITRNDNGTEAASASNVGDDEQTPLDGTSVTTVPTGDYTFAESAHTGTGTSADDYTSKLSCSNNGGNAQEFSGVLNSLTVNDGDSWVCTYVNTRKTGTITVVKRLVPSTDDGRFDLLVDGNVKANDVGNNGTTDQVVVPTGTYPVTEAGGNQGVGGSGPLTDLSHYVKSTHCEAPGQDPIDNADGPTVSVPVGAGQNWTCTITNARKATVRVDKVVPGGSDQKFGFTTTLTDGPSEFQLADADAPVVREVAPGQDYTVTEPDPGTGFKLTSSGCGPTNPQVDTPRLSTRAPTAEANKTVSITPGAGDDITCTFVNTKLAGGLKVVKTGPGFAYNGDTLTFQYAVTNTGNTPINITSITDDKCSSITGPVKNNSNDDTWLDPHGTPDASKSEEWIYTCSMPAPVTKAGDPSLVNTVTVNGKDEKGNDVTAQDQHTTAFLHPAVGIAKTGPATALAGSLVQYTLTVTNPGDVAFADPLVVVTDTLCQAPPALSSKNGDSSPLTFDPKDTWTYTCSVQTQVGQTAVDNVADVKGTDQNGRSATAQAKFSTQLTQPQVVVAPETVTSVTPGSAKLRGPTGCPTRATTAAVTGKRITKVTFYVDGKKVKTVTRPDSKGRWSLGINPRKFAFGSHKVRVTVEFAANSGTKTKTLQLSFNRCRPAIVKPKFTG